MSALREVLAKFRIRKLQGVTAARLRASTRLIGQSQHFAFTCWLPCTPRPAIAGRSASYFFGRLGCPPRLLRVVCGSNTGRF